MTISLLVWILAWILRFELPVMRMTRFGMVLVLGFDLPSFPA